MKLIRHSGPHAGLRALTAFGVLSFSLSACQDAIAPGTNAKLAQPSALFSASGNSGRQIADEYIVVFENSVSDVSGRAKGLLNAHGGDLHATYSSALKGFSAHMSAQAAAAIAKLPDVAYVEADQEFALSSVQPYAAWGLDRIDQARILRVAQESKSNRVSPSCALLVRLRLEAHLEPDFAAVALL